MKKKEISLLHKNASLYDLYDFESIKLPTIGTVKIYNSDYFPIGSAIIKLKHDRIVAQNIELDKESYLDYYLEPILEDKNDYIEINALMAFEDIIDSNSGLTINEKLHGKNYIQDKFTIKKVHELMKKYNLSVRDISEFTGIQYNSLYQYIGGEKSKPILPMSKVIKSTLYLYFKSEFGVWF